jgi:hypothetical protein
MNEHSVQRQRFSARLPAILLTLFAQFAVLQQLVAEEPVNPATGGWKKALVDCLDKSTWEVVLFPDERGAWIFTKNCSCSDSAAGLKKELEATGQSYLRQFADMIKQGRPIDIKGMVEEGRAHMLQEYELADDQGIVLEVALGEDEQEKSVNMYCYTPGLFEQYLERVEEVAREAR